jgi:hypothetical protein
MNRESSLGVALVGLVVGFRGDRVGVALVGLVVGLGIILKEYNG